MPAAKTIEVPGAWAAALTSALLIAQQVGGKGGGRPDLAQAGGTEPGKLPQALTTVAEWVKQRMA